MKDIVITARRIRTELITFLACFICANLLNLYAIIVYNTAYLELFTQVGYVLLFAIALYALWIFIRIIFYFGRKIFITKKQKVI